ncbi:unnamed protein product [Spirodela intermedia]|uniref:Uncharacterized protein n=2 Tax=Spirodela intermedia TaxID=51605 RepID=A0A7I8JNT2_SPIIN|nr:unnamed protein product [Spirodela intermedia]CAA6671834.1 unnamed protein product [Spirodela intermedia]CAA7408966.1 unnamed protein product [Spirodela intermedia]
MHAAQLQQWKKAHPYQFQIDNMTNGQLDQ